MNIGMNLLYVTPSLITAVLLFSIAAYLLVQRPRKHYIVILVVLALTMFTWNVAVILTNITEGDIAWAKLSTLALVFIPALIFHFTAVYTDFFNTKKYLLAYLPFVAIALILPTTYYVNGVEYIGFGYEPSYSFIPFTIHSWGGFVFLVFSIFMLVQYYRESVGIKQRQILLILFAIPTNALLSYVSFGVMVDILEIAQFPVGAILDTFMVILVSYSVIHFKLPTATAAEIDFRLLSETASEGICIIDPKGDIDYANTHFAGLVSTPAQKLLNCPFKQFVADDYIASIQEALRSTMQGNKITNLDINLLQGTCVLNTEINTSPIHWNKKIIGAFFTIRNITERKQTEQELKRQKTYFQALFECSPEAIVSMDRHHHVQSVNPAFISIFGYTGEELQGKDIDDFILPDAQMEEGRSITRHVVSGETVKKESVRCRKDGSLVPVSVLGAPIFVGDQQVGVYAIYRDITNRKEAEEEREYYNSLLRHDVANRNMVVQGNLEILDSLHLTPEQKSLVLNALNSAKASTNLIRKVRDLRAIEGEHPKSPVILQKVVDEAVLANRQQIEDRNITITVNTCDVTVLAGPFLDSIVSNLLQNAIVHSGCSHIDVVCDTATIDGTTYHSLAIADDGTGISLEDKLKVFRPGFKRRGSPGSGLGLYLVKKMVDNYEGLIKIKNREDTGTVVTVYLKKT